MKDCDGLGDVNCSDQKHYTRVLKNSCEGLTDSRSLPCCVTEHALPQTASVRCIGCLACHIDTCVSGMMSEDGKLAYGRKVKLLDGWNLQPESWAY